MFIHSADNTGEKSFCSRHSTFKQIKLVKELRILLSEGRREMSAVLVPWNPKEEDTMGGEVVHTCSSCQMCLKTESSRSEFPIAGGIQAHTERDDRDGAECTQTLKIKRVGTTFTLRPCDYEKQKWQPLTSGDLRVIQWQWCTTDAWEKVLRARSPWGSTQEANGASIWVMWRRAS